MRLLAREVYWRSDNQEYDQISQKFVGLLKMVL